MTVIKIEQTGNNYLPLFIGPKKKRPHNMISYKAFNFNTWCEPGSNRRHKDFQSFALPTELPHHPFQSVFPYGIANIKAFMNWQRLFNKIILLGCRILLTPDPYNAGGC